MPAIRTTAWVMLAALAVAEFLGMTLWFSATAVTPVLVAEFGMSTTHASWLTIAVQAGFVVGTLASALANLADVFNARVVFLGGTVLARQQTRPCSWWTRRRRWWCFVFSQEPRWRASIHRA